MKNNFIILASVFLGLWLVYILFQNEQIYNYSLRLITKNWTNQNGERKLVEKPFEKITNENLIQWDGVHYKFIKENRYNIAKAGGDYIFAFFPFFPLLWDLTHLSPIGIVILNYILFSIGLLILTRALNFPDQLQLLLSLSFPGLVCFLIPYTEATFMIASAIGIYGLLKNRYWVFFLGFTIASMTRPSITILFLSFFTVESILLMQHRKVGAYINSLAKNITPLVIGTLSVSIYQLYYHSNSLFKFAQVQSLWGKKLGIPHQIIDWSHEGFGMNIAVFSFVFIPTILLFYKISKKIIGEKEGAEVDKTTYLILLSAIYMIGSTFYILLFQNGCLNGYFRYTQCTPFFFLLILLTFNYIKEQSFQKRVITFSILFGLGILNLTIIPYSNRWNFSDTGFFIFSMAFLLWALQDKRDSLIYKVALTGLMIINLVWTSFLFNTYISNGWIFT